MKPLHLAIALFTATAVAQTTPLPANYKTIFENSDLLVMRVHYGPHEFVPMHDHTAYPTVYVYLNNSGEVRIDHEQPKDFSLTRPPTHTGAFRIAPGASERHSITNLSDTPSDFLRIELKRIPPTALKTVFRGEVPAPLPIEVHNEFQNSALRIDRIDCPPAAPCELPPSFTRALLVAITPLTFLTPQAKHALHPGDVLWLPPATNAPTLTPAAQTLRIQLLYPE
jgi:hypothetical protein